MRSSHVDLDQVDIAFDDPRAVAHAGLLLPAILAERLGIERATDQLVDLGDRPGAKSKCLNRTRVTCGLRPSGPNRWHGPSGTS
jgi:hypothetical protein